jgi:hypothetical protein
MQMHTPPENQGQIVETSYGWHEGSLYRCTLDRSDRSVSWERYDGDGSEDVEPWNGDPSRDLDRAAWVACDDPEVRP